MEIYLNYHEDKRNPIIFIDFKKIDDACCSEFPNETFPGEEDLPDKDSLRSTEKNIVTLTQDDNEDELIAFAITSNIVDNDLNAILSLCRTIFVTIVLTVAAMMFTGDVEKIVLDPIESMLKTVKRIAENPLEAAKVEE